MPPTRRPGTASQIMTHAGQGCAITRRLLLPRQRYDEGVAAARRGDERSRYGDPTDPAYMMGPLISERQRERVLGYIETGVDEGATVARRRRRPSTCPKGYFVEPTVLVDVDPPRRSRRRRSSARCSS